jgi:hypothetical protein
MKSMNAILRTCMSIQSLLCRRLEAGQCSEKLAGRLVGLQTGQVVRIWRLRTVNKGLQSGRARDRDLVSNTRSRIEAQKRIRVCVVSRVVEWHVVK